MGLRGCVGARAPDSGARHLFSLHSPTRRGARFRIIPAMTAAIGKSREVGAGEYRDTAVARPRHSGHTPLSFGRVALWLVVSLVLIYLIFPVFVVVPVSFSSAKYL